MKKTTREEKLSDITTLTEAAVGTAGVLSGNSIIQILALTPSLLEKFFLNTGIIKNDMPQTLQIQWERAVEQTFKKCEQRTQHEYLGKVIKLLELYMQDMTYGDLNFSNIEEWLQQTLAKEKNENGIYITSAEVLKVIELIVSELKHVIVFYPELSGYVALDTVEQILKIEKKSVNEGENRKAPRLLTEKAPLPPPEYYGRIQEFNKIVKKMQWNSKFVLVNGMGGVGKSTLARKLYHYFLNESKRQLIWITYNGNNLRDDFMQQMLYPPNCNENEIQLFLLNELNDNAVVFVDNMNATEVEDEFIATLATFKCYVICTSRVKNLRFFENVDIDFFDENESIELFSKYYTKEYDEKLIREIVVTRAKRHTLVIEVIAKIAMSEELTLQQTIDELDVKGFNLSGTAEINFDEKTLVGHLCKLFSTKKLTGQQKSILVNMAVLETNYIPEEFTKWMELPNKSGIIYLEKHAWINKTETGYYMHPLISEVVKRLCNTSYIMIKKMVKNLADALKFIPEQCVSDIVGNLIYAQNIVRRYGNICTEEMAALLYDMAVIQWQCCEYNEAEKSVKKAIKNAKKIEGFPQRELGEYINHHGVICHSQRKNHRALRIYEDVLEMQKKVGDKRDQAQTLCNLSLEYQILYEIEMDKQYIEKAFDSQMQANVLFEEIFKNKKHPDMASSYNNTGRLLLITKDICSAIEYFEKAKVIREEILPEKHEDMGLTYYFLGCAYEEYAYLQNDKTDRNRYMIEANAYLKKALAIRIHNFDRGIKKYSPEEIREKLEKLEQEIREEHEVTQDDVNFQSSSVV